MSAAARGRVAAVTFLLALNSSAQGGIYASSFWTGERMDHRKAPARRLRTQTGT